MDKIRKVLQLATKYHQGQLDKVGVSYIEHLKTVKNLVKLKALGSGTFSKDQIKQAMQVALLHDILEDTSCTEQEILEVADPEVLRVVKLLTKSSKLDKKQKLKYFTKIKQDKIAKLVKACDLIHNSDLTRFKHQDITSKDLQRTRDYIHWLTFLSSKE